MTTVVSTVNTEINTPTSYVSRWIAQSHGSYQKKGDDYYTPSSDYRSSILHIPIKTLINVPITTWQAQAKVARSNISSMNFSSNISSDQNNHELQEKLNHIRTLLDAKKQRLCRHLSSPSNSSPPPSPSPSTTTTTTTTVIFPVVQSFQDPISNSTAVGDSSSTFSPPSPLRPPPSSSSSSSLPLVLENVYQSHDDSLSSSHYSYMYNSCHHHHHHSSPSILPCLMEESPSDSGLSDQTKTTNQDDIPDCQTNNAAIIDLSKPLSKEEMLAIMQIIRELWKKRFNCDIPEIPIKSEVPVSTFKRIEQTTNISKLNPIQYRSTPILNKLNAELNDIKDKLKRFSIERQSSIVPHKSSTNDIDDSMFVSFGTPLTSEDHTRMQTKKDALLHRQIQRREEQLMKKNERQIEAAERHDEYRLFEEYLSQRRHEIDQRRQNILQGHLEQKRFEADSSSSNNYYFSAARHRYHLKRKSSTTSLLSLDDDLSHNGSLNLLCTPKRSLTRFDFISPSLTAPTTASRSKMNRAASTCEINGHYDSFNSLNSKATIPTSLFGGSLMNISKMATPKKRSFNIIDNPLDQSQFSGSMTSLATSITGSRLGRNQTLFSTKSNKQTIINSLKQVALAGPTNDRQRETIIRQIESSEARHFVLLFRDHRLQFRAVYMYIPETDVIEKLHGIGPNLITEIMVDKWFKYNSGSKRFTNIPIKHFSIQCDAVIIYNDFWQKKLLTAMNKLH